MNQSVKFVKVNISLQLLTKAQLFVCLVTSNVEIIVMELQLIVQCVHLFTTLRMGNVYRVKAFYLFVQLVKFHKTQQIQCVWPVFRECLRVKKDASDANAAAMSAKTKLCAPLANRTST